jgi:hypothetical protein
MYVDQWKKAFRNFLPNIGKEIDENMIFRELKDNNPFFVNISIRFYSQGKTGNLYVDTL